MKRFVILAVILAVALAAGCSKKEPEKAKTGTEQVKAGTQTSLLDPVSKKPVDILSTPYSYEYDGVMYHFESQKNLDDFRKDPAKYVKN
ncbi:MAG: YHS domain-containing protein [Candidatus Krumholzibacteriota bacterium]|nr:YHS domain-containing protein [Candidatus Krumholzibacteriota bacterium]